VGKGDSQPRDQRLDRGMSTLVAAKPEGIRLAPIGGKGLPEHGT
jgi:hypothetical protein